MSKPSFSNIDLWLFELSEGNLSPEQVQQLELFLFQHPEFDIDRDMWEVARVDKTPITYPNVKELERKRRPVGFYAVSSLVVFLLFWGNYSYNYIGDSGEVSHAEKLGNQRAEIRAKILAELSKENQTFTKYSSQPNQILNKNNSNEVYASNEFNHFATNHSKNNTTRIKKGDLYIPSTILTSKDEVSEDWEMITEWSKKKNDGDLISYTSDEQELVLAELEELFHKEDLADWTGKDYVHRIVVSDDQFGVREPRTAHSFEFSNSQKRTKGSLGRYDRYSGYSSSLKMKISKFGRSVRRMMDNPIALKNSRDPMYLVPGLLATDISFSSAGTLLATRVLASSRIQWLGQPNEQLMSQLSIDGYSFGIRGGWGVQLNHSMYNDGGIHVGQVALSYSPKISVSNQLSVEPSVRFKMGDKHLNASQMYGVDRVEIDRGNVQDFYQNGESPIGKNLWYKDLGLGLLVNTKWFFVGAQIDNIFRYKDNFYSVDVVNPRRVENSFIATVGTDWVSRYGDLSLSPYMVYQKNEQLSELWAGATMDWNKITFGLAGSSNLDPAVSLGMKFDHFSFTYKADYTKSIMTQQRSLSHQVTLRFLTKQSRFTRH
ncbi:MAG: type IX secretion system membrane protein PorP/SprF [Crocinitomicaceae bacterium]|nr:type IX secretion system membrane protein PorP/SprF [Crocinitomicaceae bacterium]